MVAAGSLIFDFVLTEIVNDVCAIQLMETGGELGLYPKPPAWQQGRHYSEKRLEVWTRMNEQEITTLLRAFLHSTLQVRACEDLPFHAL